VPAIKPAAERTRSGLVSVLATPGTVKRQYTRDLIRDYADTVHVRLVGSENLAELAETYMRKGFVDEAAVKAEIEPCFVEKDGQKTDIVVLACTHFPFLVNRMRKLAPWPVDWIDPAEAIARRALAIVETLPGGHALPDARDSVVFTSGDPGLQRSQTDARLRTDRRVRAGGRTRNPVYFPDQRRQGRQILLGNAVAACWPNRRNVASQFTE
jgi:glutamate racemase